MEIIEKNNSGKMGTLGAVLLAAGAALLCYALWMLPHSPVYGFPWVFALAVVSFLPIMAGGWCLNAVVLRRCDHSYRYGNDGRNGNGGGVAFALLVMIAGGMLLCFNAGLLPHEWKRVFFSWQMLLLVGAMSDYARGRFVWASVMLAVGGFFIIRGLAPITSRPAVRVRHSGRCCLSLRV